MDRLPPELLLHVFEFLDGPAPSEIRLHDQPSHHMLSVKPASHTLKTVSLICTTWRTLVKPALFRHVLWRPKMSSLSAFTLNPIPLLRFLEENRLDRGVLTFTLLVDFFDKEADAKQTTPEIRPVDLEWLWDQLFSVIDPLRFTIIARPTTLAAFLSRMLFLDDAWSFNMPYHILSVARTSRCPTSAGKSLPDEKSVARISTSQQSPSEHDNSATFRSTTTRPATAGHSTSPWPIRHKKPPACLLFTARPWTSLLLNEGSSTRVYRTYEFFLRRPPSMLGAILGCEEYPNDTPLIPSTIVDFNYIAIFPLSSHFETLLQNLPRLDRLFVQLTPKPDNNILGDKDEMKQVDAADLWMERNTAYSFIMRELAFVPDPRGNWSTLRVFESGDAADKEAWDMAVQFIERSGIENWKVEREGVFVHHVNDEDNSALDEGVNGHRGGSANGVEAGLFQGSLRRVAFRAVARLPFSSMWLYMRDVDPNPIPNPNSHPNTYPATMQQWN